MKKNKRIPIALISLAVCGLSNTLKADGLMGSNYISGTVTLTQIDAGNVDIDTMGLSVAYNYNAISEPTYGVDFVLDASWTRDDEDFLDVEQTTLGYGGRMYYHTTATLRPYWGGGIGWLWSDNGFSSEDSFAYLGTLGLEWEALSNLTFTPAVTYMEAVDIDNSREITWSLEAAYWITPQLNTAITYAFTDAKGNPEADSIGITARWRF